MTAVDRTAGPHLDTTASRHPAPPPRCRGTAGGALPRLPSTVVPRARLTRRLDRLAALTVVDALPGLGARTLVAAWAHERHAAGSHVTWVRAQPDEAAAGLLDRLHAGLVLTGALPRGVATEPEQWVSPLGRARRPVIVVVDQAQALSGGLPERLLGLVQSAHPVHLVLRGLDLQAIVETARRRGVDTQVLRSSDLWLRLDELPTLAAAWGHPTDAGTLDTLHRHVGGWMLPLRLALDAAPGPAALHAAHEFVRQEVLPLLPGGADDVAVSRLAVPTAIDRTLADALLGASGPTGALLARLERRGLLWRAAGPTGRTEWTFPALVRATLLEQLEHDAPDVARQAHGATARVLLSRAGTDVAELVEHARAAGDEELLTELWLEQGWTLIGTEVAAFERAYDPGPAGWRGDALLMPAALARASRQLPRDADWMRRTETMMRRYAELGEQFLAERSTPGSPACHTDLLTAAMVARRGEGRLDDAVAMARALERTLRARRTTAKRGLAAQASWAWVQAAITHLLAGRLGEAHRLALAANDASPHNLLGGGAAAARALPHPHRRPERGRALARGRRVRGPQRRVGLPARRAAGPGRRGDAGPGPPRRARGDGAPRRHLVDR